MLLRSLIAAGLTLTEFHLMQDDFEVGLILLTAQGNVLTERVSLRHFFLARCALNGWLR